MGIDVIYIVIVLGVILVSMTLHEAMHAFVGYWLGDDTARQQGRLTLNPIKHIDPVLTIILPISLAILGGPIFGGARPVPFNPLNVRLGEWGAALIAIAGPLTNLVIAFISYGVWVLFGGFFPEVGEKIVALFITVNLGFFVFNMLPIPPLDGSRVIYALAPEFIRKGMVLMETFGILLIFVLVLIAGSVLDTYMSQAVGFFLGLFQAVFNR